GDAAGARPGAPLSDRLAAAVAGEGELAAKIVAGILVDDGTDVVRKERGEHAVDDHLRHRDFTAEGLVACLEIDRLGETKFGARACFSLKVQALRRRQRWRQGR